MASALTGCGKVLDWRNAEVSNGKVYEQGANKPFSGKVTNVPQEKISPSSDGWRLAVSPIANTPNWSNKINTGYSLCDLKADDGQIDGEVVCTSLVTKQLLYKVNFKKGLLHGKFVLYDASADQKPYLTASFVNGKIDGTHKLISPKNQQVLFQAEWDEGVPHGEQARFDEETGKKTFTSTFKKGLLEGDIYTWAPDGKTVLLHGTARNGKLEGPEQVFYPDGKKKSEKVFKDGQEHGVRKVWDETGKLVDHTRYENGAWTENLPLPGQPAVAEEPDWTPEDVACVDKWIAVRRKEIGLEAPIPFEQKNEWKAWCRAGKRPS